MDNEILSPPKEGACSSMPTAFFFPDSRTRGITKDMRKAISTCHSCLVQNKCAEYGIHHEMFGIWGGLTEKRRVALRKERGITLKQPGYFDPATNKARR